MAKAQYKRNEIISAMRRNRWHLYGAVTVLPDGRANSEMFVLAATPEGAGRVGGIPLPAYTG